MGAEEKWKDIIGYEGLYQVSNLGRVKSLNYRNTGEEKIRKLVIDKYGYFVIPLRVNGKSKQHFVHRLVALTFIPNPDNLPQIDHINTDRTDNRVENLRWCTAKENSNNPLTIDKKRKNPRYGVTGVNNVSSTVVMQFSNDGKFIKKWNCITDVQRELGINRGNVIKCCKGKRKSAGGYIWRYYYKGIWIKNHIPLKDKMAS